MRNIIAKYTIEDHIRDEIDTITVFEEKYVLGYLYTVNVENNNSFHSFEFDDMTKALCFANENVVGVPPTNGGIPAFDDYER